MVQTVQNFPKLASVERIARIPVVETGFGYASGVYLKIKRSNSLVSWSFETVEGGIQKVAVKSIPMLELPLGVVDSIVCKTLDEVEHRVPAINYPPEQLYNITKDMVSSRIVQPVLKRADSVKQFSVNNPRLSKYGELAVSRLDTALDRADEYVEKYLPDPTERPDKVNHRRFALMIHDIFRDLRKHANVEEQGEESKTKRTIQHANRLSRKLQRRLTRKTIMEAQALRKTGQDVGQFIYFSIDLLIKDPREFANKMRQIWAHLSEDEPENQIPPENLDQLIALVAREASRRIVHAVNYSVVVAGNLPNDIAHLVNTANHHAMLILDSLLKTAHLEGIKTIAFGRAEIELSKLANRLSELYQLIRNTLMNSAPSSTVEPKPITGPQEPKNQQEQQQQNQHAHQKPRKTPKKDKKEKEPNQNGSAPTSEQLEHHDHHE